MNLQQLKYFCKLAELQHYTRAAEQLYITQPTLSNSISRLEEDLGVPLFRHQGRNVVLTKYGRDFYHYALDAVTAIEKGTQQAHEQAGEHTGVVDVGTIYTIQDHYLPHLVREFRKAYGEGFTINMYQGLTRTLMEDLTGDRYDVMFGAYTPNREDLVFIPVLHQKLRILVHRKSPLAAHASISLSQLTHEHLITYRPETPLGSEVKFIMDEEGLVAAEGYDDEITVASMVDANPRAVGICLETLGAKVFDDLVLRPIDDVSDDFHPVYLIYKKDGYKTPAVKNFIEFVKKQDKPAE